MHWKKGKLTLKLAYLYLKYGTDTARTINDVVFLQMLPLPEWFTTAACVEITHHWRSLAVPESKCSLVDLFELLYSHDFSDIIFFVLFNRSKWDDPRSLGLHFLYRSSQAKKHQNCPKSAGGHAQRVPILVPLWFEGFRKGFGTQPFDLLSVQSHGHLARRTPELAHRN